MNPVSKCLIINITCMGIQSVDEAKLVNDFMGYALTTYANVVCDGFNISPEGVSVNYKPITQQTHTVYDLAKATDYVDTDMFTKMGRDFVEEGLLSCRSGHVLTTGNVTINFNTVFLGTGSVIITQEVFKSCKY